MHRIRLITREPNACYSVAVFCSCVPIESSNLSLMRYPGISFLQPSFKDYPVYLTKFKQCLSRAMLLIKSHTVSTLQNLTAQLTKRVRLIWTTAWLMIRSQMIVSFPVCLLNMSRAGPAGRSERRQRLHALLCEVQSSGTQSSGETCVQTLRLFDLALL